MSLTAPSSPSQSSSNSDDGFADLDAELLALTSDEEEEEESPKNDGEDDEEEEEENPRNKRQKVDKEAEGSTLFGTLQQETGASTSDGICHHPAFVGGMCVVCAKREVDDSAVALGYIHKALKVGSQELDRLRRADLESLVQKRKLYLVLDLDHTLLNSARFIDISEKENFLMSQADSLQDIPKGSLFRLDWMAMLTKLRPFVRKFLKEANTMFEMYIYTMGEKPYAEQMARLLDPEDIYFKSKVISQADCTTKHQKDLDVVMGADNAVVILDDTEQVWRKHKENLITIERYHFFAKSGHSWGITKSLSESSRDEAENGGILSAILDVLKRVHGMFYNSNDKTLLLGRDVRQVLRSVRKEVLNDCKLLFSHTWKKTERPQNERLWLMAEQLGASCTTKLEDSVTHVVSLNTGTEKARWARKERKFLVNPGWIEAANFFWKRQAEEAFQILPTIKKDLQPPTQNQLEPSTPKL